MNDLDRAKIVSVVGFVFAVLVMGVFLVSPVSAGGFTPNGATSIDLARSNPAYWLYPGQTYTFTVDNSGWSGSSCKYCNNGANPYSCNDGFLWSDGNTSITSRTITVPVNAQLVEMYGIINGFPGSVAPGSGRNWNVSSYTENKIITSSFTMSPSSDTHYYPIQVNFTDTSSGGPTAWNWNFGDGSANSTVKNPSHTYSASGSYTITLTASDGAISGTSSQTYVVKSYVIPVCSYSTSGLVGTSPMQVTFTDTSSNMPSDYIWNFNSGDYGWLTVLPSSYNTTSNPTVTFTGTGSIPILHTVSNPAGTAYCPTAYLNISGVAITPTLTPNIPFPNQTDICLNSGITLGDGSVNALGREATVNTPGGSSYGLYIAPNSPATFSGSTFTGRLGQYIYNQYDPSGILEWRMSWIVINCAQTPGMTIPTTIPTITQTQVYPTVTGTINPQNTLTNLPTIAPSTTYPSTIPVNLSSNMNSTTLKSDLAKWNTLTLYWTDLCDFIVMGLNNSVMYLVNIAISPVSYLSLTLNYIISLNDQYLSSISGAFVLMYHTIADIITNLHWKVKFAITIGLTFDILIQIIGLKKGKWS